MQLIRKYFILLAFVGLFLFSFVPIAFAHDGHEHPEEKTIIEENTVMPKIFIGTGILFVGIGTILLYRHLFPPNKK